MPYGKLLYKEMLKNNINVMQLSEMLGKDHSYISKILKGSVNPPKEKINDEIAKILNTDVRKLNLESYFDKAPQEMKSVMYTFTKTYITFIYSIFNKIVNGREDIDIEKLSNDIKNEPISEVLLSIIDNKEVIIKNSENLGEEMQFEDMGEDGFFAIMKLTTPFSIRVSDSGFAPIIPEDSKIKLEYKNEYLNGDIIALNGKNGIIVRKMMTKDDYYYLMPENTEFDLMKIAKVDAKNIILGKVIECIIKI